MTSHPIRTFDLATALLKRPEMRQALYDEAATLLGSAVINLHGAPHRARRGVETKIFRKDYFQFYEKNILRPELEETLAPYVGAGEADLVDLGYRLMINLTADFAGIDRPERTPEATADLVRILIKFTLAPVLDQSTLESIAGIKAELAAAIAEFNGCYLMPSIARRKAIIAAVADGSEPSTALPRDVLTILLQEQDELGMSHLDLLQETIFFLLAGAHTSVHTLTHVMDEIFRWSAAHPEQAYRLRDDPFFVQRCVYESLRLHPTSPMAKRRPACPVHVEPLGDLDESDDVTILLEEANADPAVFGADAASFRPDREVPAGISQFGLSMGMGAHACLGRNLAAGAAPKDDSDPATHHYGTVPMIVTALIAAGVRPHPDKKALKDTTTTRTSWAYFPVVFGKEANAAR